MPVIRDRIKELRRVRASDLHPDPRNPRRHPERQRSALRAMLSEVGFADALLARETPDGLVLVDGHLRAETTPDQEVPVLVLDVTEEEAGKLLLTLDPLSAWAEVDMGAEGALFNSVQFEQTEAFETAKAMMREMAARFPPPPQEPEALEAPTEMARAPLTLRVGHVLDVLASMPADSVHCAVTSPPYWALRDYGLPPQVWGGDPAHSHEWADAGQRMISVNDKHSEGKSTLRDWASSVASYGSFCACGAWLGSFGLEPTIDLYIEHLVEIFRAVRRVLRSDGTCWLNIGDCYAGPKTGGRNDTDRMYPGSPEGASPRGNVPVNVDLGPKQLLGMPWRAAFALQADGWYLRSAIVWAKGISFCPAYSGSVMPESVSDRPTVSYEMMFLLARSEDYFYDAEAVREPGKGMWNSHDGFGGPKNVALHVSGQTQTRGTDSFHPDLAQFGHHLRSVWAINPQPTSDAHFATFPEALVTPCILAGTSEAGCCQECGAPFQRVVAASGGTIGSGGWQRRSDDALEVGHRIDSPHASDGSYHRETLGWKRSCEHKGASVPCVVLDPFAGSGTTLKVAHDYGRASVGIELSTQYADILRKRLLPFAVDVVEGSVPV